MDPVRKLRAVSRFQMRDLVGPRRLGASITDAMNLNHRRDPDSQRHHRDDHVDQQAALAGTPLDNMQCHKRNRDDQQRNRK